MTRGRSIADADRDVRQFLVRIAAALGDALGDMLAGLYVHGSLATGSYHRERSDIDLIAVTTVKLSPELRERVAGVLVRLSDARPTLGDIEVSLVQERYARSFEHPLPYEVHYSSAANEFCRGTYECRSGGRRRRRPGARGDAPWSAAGRHVRPRAVACVR
jgi:streptomycin 3"-adenylyltransferase